MSATYIHTDINALSPLALLTKGAGVPTAVTAVAGNAQATVSWTAGSAPVGTSVYFEVVSSPATTTQVLASGGTFTGLTNGVTYTFKVTAVTLTGLRAQSAASNAVTPANTYTPPSNVGLSAPYDVLTGWVTTSCTVTTDQQDQTGAANSAQSLKPLNAVAQHSIFAASANYQKLGAFLKAAGYGFAAMYRQGNTTDYTVIDLSTGIATDHGAAVSTVHAGGNGFYFLLVDFGSVNNAFPDIVVADTAPHAVPGTAWTADGTSYIIAYNPVTI